ncbi:MAG: hypothetical protein HZC40_09040 [Chloroflexi bacterium]|nr:hypothetical protein [Chloroflexota bacterium]
MSRKIALIGSLVIAAVAFIAYQPALKIQFYDGWWYLEWVATMDVPRYAIQFLDPANITQGYRPVQGLYVLILYRLFGFNPDGYHHAHTLLHAANAILLFLIVARIGKRVSAETRAAQIGLIAALVYAVSPVITLAVFWHAVVDPLSAFFYLLTILLWSKYLETGTRADYWLAFLAYLFALFSKEVAIFLAPILFLIEWWMYKRNVFTASTVKRFAPFLVLLIPYLYLVVSVQSHGEFSSQFGFQIGAHMLGNLMPYLAVLTLPWTNELPTEPFYFIWLIACALAYLAITLYKRNLVLLFIALVAGLNISPLTGFPLDYFNTRYLYLSLMSTAIVAALVFHALAQKFLPRRAFGIIASAIVVLAIIASSARVADAAATLSEYTRQLRVPFRDIAQKHPTFPDDAYIYFVYSPVTSVWDFKGLFFVRYGNTVKVDATDSGYPVELRSHNAAFVYYFDPTGKPIQVPVEKNLALRSAPTLPVNFESGITLASFDATGATFQRNSALVVILNWRAGAKIENEYTMFAHLVNARGEKIATSDSPPRRGALPTRAWEPNREIVDAIVLPIPVDAPLGDQYRLEIGMYDSATQQRVPITGVDHDSIVIESFKVVP